MVRSRKKLFLAVLAFLAMIGSVAFGQEPATIDKTYLSSLSVRVTNVGEGLFDLRTVAGPGSICGNREGGYSVWFSVSNRNYHIQYKCMYDGMLIEYGGFLYVDQEGDGTIDIVHEGTLQNRGRPVFADFLLPTDDGRSVPVKINLDRRDHYQARYANALTDLDSLLLSIHIPPQSI